MVHTCHESRSKERHFISDRGGNHRGEVFEFVVNIKSVSHGQEVATVY